jgi:hypothetical protein
MGTMSLTSKEFLALVSEARSIFFQEFNIETTAPVECCTETEITEIILQDAQERNLSEEWIQNILRKIPFLRGIYLGHIDRAYVIFGRGNNLPIIIHELLHSIQLCNSNRHNILNYIAFRLTNDERFLDPTLKREWEAREEEYTWERISRRIFLAGDCEDFNSMSQLSRKI